MLTELKDKIHCVTDQVMEKAGKYDPSGYFLIEVRIIFSFSYLYIINLMFFCLNPSATYYSKPVLNWLWNSKDEALIK